MSERGREEWREKEEREYEGEGGREGVREGGRVSWARRSIDIFENVHIR